MSLLQWLLSALQRLLHDHVGGRSQRSPLKAILALWSLSRRQFHRYSSIARDRTSPKGPGRVYDRDKCLPPPSDFTMMMVDGTVDGQAPVSTVVCRSVVPPDNSNSIYSCAVENASESSLNSVATLATPMTLTSRSQVNLADYAHVNLSTRRLPRHGSRPSSTVHLPTDQSPLHPYSCSNTSRSSQSVRRSMPNWGHTHIGIHPLTNSLVFEPPP